MDSIRKRLTGDYSGESTSNFDDLGELCPSLTYKQRIIGFGVCFGFGLFLSLLVSD
jgi:hypothetical protein